MDALVVSEARSADFADQLAKAQARIKEVEAEPKKPGWLQEPAVDDRWTLLANWRQAIARQLLTPAPDTAAVAWKKAALADGQHEYTDIKTERVERAIANDVAFLAAHPTRRQRSTPTMVTS